MSTSTTALQLSQPALSEVGQSTLLGFLAGYRGLTRDAYTLDLRQFTAWCWQHDRRLFDVHRVDIECFARATVARRLCMIVGFYRYAEEEGVIEQSPGVHIRRPRIDFESHVALLDRNELSAILVAKVEHRVANDRVSRRGAPGMPSAPVRCAFEDQQSVIAPA